MIQQKKCIQALEPTKWSCDYEKLFSLFKYRYAAAAAKSLQSCPTLCDPIDSSPPGSLIPGILQARTLEVGCHFLLQCMKVKSESEVAQSCPTSSNSMDCSLPGSSIHGIFVCQYVNAGAQGCEVFLCVRAHIQKPCNMAATHTLQVEELEYCCHHGEIFLFGEQLLVKFQMTLSMIICWILNLCKPYFALPNKMEQGCRL